MNQYMSEALELGESVLGGTYPNPPVGAVLVSGDGIVGRGATLPAGQAHAEVVCIDDAGGKASGADMFVTLEPCSHHGKTPPCTEKIIAAGIRRVFIACSDPNPLVNGKGVRRLEAAGIEVHTGLLAEDAEKRLYRPFFYYIRTGLPWITVKYAMTLDGKIACQSGSSQWISGPASRGLAHRLRREHQAILVGAGTVRTDDPSLDYRGEDSGDPRFQPLRMVLSRTGNVPESCRMFRNDGKAMFWTAHGKNEHLPSGVIRRTTGPDMKDFVRAAGKEGIVSLLVEGGRGILDGIMEAGLYNEIVVFVAPKLVGGDRSPVGAVLASVMDETAVLEGEWTIIENDACYRGVRVG